MPRALSSALLFPLALGACASVLGVDFHPADSVDSKDAAPDAALDSALDGATASTCSPACGPVPKGHTECRGGRCELVCSPGFVPMQGQCTEAVDSAFDSDPYPRIAAGLNFTCALTSAAAVWCWGSGFDGATGLGTTKDFYAPQHLSSLDGAVALAAGARHVCAIRSDARVTCWGDNRDGQVSPSQSDTTRSVPTEVAGVSDVQAIAAGSAHTCALTQTGRVLCWGANSDGQLGRGTTSLREAPAEVVGLAAPAHLFANGKYTYVQDTRGSLLGFGSNRYGELGLGNGAANFSATPQPPLGLGAVAALALSALDVCALLPTHKVACWGMNQHGQLARGYTSTDPTLVPTEIADLRANGLAAGDGAFCAHASTGEVVCWGHNEIGQLGTADRSTSVLKPSAVEGLRAAVHLGGSGYHYFAHGNDGVIRAWGSNTYGQLGIGTASTVPVTPPIALQPF